MKYILLSVIITLASCMPNQKDQQKVIPNETTQIIRDGMYNFNSPDNTIELADELREISGLSVFNEHQLIAINDELGVVYFMNKTTGVIVHTQDIGPKGDYESIEKVGDILYVLQNNGDILRYNFTTQQQLDRIKTKLKSKNDIEGLTYDKVNNRLLLAAKGKPYIKSNKRENSVKSIYAFDLNTETLGSEPVIEISDKEIEDFAVNQSNFESLSGFDQTTTIRRMQSFAPSAIAIHPSTGDYYILSSRGKMLMIFNPNTNQISDIKLLDEYLHTQPEGLCFESNGDMYISNEGKSGKAKIMSYIY